VIVIIGASVARAFRSAHFSRRKTFAIHFEALSLFAGATGFFLFDGRSRRYGLVIGVL